MLAPVEHSDPRYEVDGLRHATANSRALRRRADATFWAPAGHDGPLPSLRLKLIRQGLQDYDYIKLASEKAGVEKVDAIVNEQVKSWTEYQQDPLKVETA